MSTHEKKVITKTLAWMEASGEIEPGSAEVIVGDLDLSGDLGDDLESMLDHIYGRPAKPPALEGDPGEPAIPPTPYLSEGRKTKGKPLVRAAMHTISPLLRAKEDAEVLAQRLIRLTEKGTIGGVARGVIKHLYEDRANHYMLADPPPAPYTVAAARKTLDEMQRYFGRHVDLDELAWKWEDLGFPSVSRAEARKRVATRLSDPKVAEELAYKGAVPEFDSEVIYGKSTESPIDHEAELRGTGKYSF